MAYKVRCESDGANYQLSYGKGGRKLTALIERDGSAFTIKAGSGFGPERGKLREVKEAWGAWAVTAYGSDAAVTISESSPPHAEAGEALAIPDEVQGSVYTTRQWEIDHARNREESWAWYHHVVRLELAHAQRDRDYVMHKYNRPPGPPMRDPVLMAQEKINESV
jgi:hypothetical protein